MKIVTKYKTNHNGWSQVVAKGLGRQKTIGFDPALSFARNYGNAAAALIQANAGKPEWEVTSDRLANARHEITGPAEHIFYI